MTKWFAKLAVNSLDLHRVAMHLFFFYLPFSYALSLGQDLMASLARGIISFIFVGLWAITSAATNDFFDRLEDVGFKENPFNTDGITEKQGLTFILTLQILAYVFTIGVAITFDLKIILFATLAGIVSWFYSDNTYIPRIAGFRLKRHYALEWISIVLGYTLLFASTMAINNVLIVESTPLFILVGASFLSAAIAKDETQVVKDSQAGNMTYQILHGQNRANRLLHITIYINILALVLFSSLGYLPRATIMAVAWLAIETILPRLDQRYSFKKGIQLVRSINPYFLIISLGFLLY